MNRIHVLRLNNTLSLSMSLWLFCCFVLTLFQSGRVFAQDAPQLDPLERELRSIPADRLASEAKSRGNARRGAMLFFQQRLACAKCHIASAGLVSLGPDLSDSKSAEKPTTVDLVEALLFPSKRIRKGYQPQLLRLDDGRLVRGRVQKETDSHLDLRDMAREGAVVRISKDEIDARKTDTVSLMPEGLVAQLGGRQQFLDLIKYLDEINELGPDHARKLQPPLSLMGIRPLPEYEGRVDHRGIIAGWDNASHKRGEEIYNRLCINCHGTKDRPGSLPTSLRFASGKFKRGPDPYSMYLTLTHGFGQMIAQGWMVPTQKYDVIHYIREAYLKPHNEDQYFVISEKYLASLPVGDTRGPAPRKFEPWATMDYGPTLTHTYEVGKDGSNFAYKGVAVRLDAGPGGVTRGSRWMVFDEDTMRWAAGWSGKGFIDYNGIMFNGRHNIHPRLVGNVEFQNPTGPGWGDPASSDTPNLSDPRLRGRDGRRYGPLPRNWAQFKGLHHFGGQAIVRYTVGDCEVMEMPGFEPHPELDAVNIFQRSMHLGPRETPLFLAVAKAPAGMPLHVSKGEQTSVAVVAPAGPAAAPQPTVPNQGDASKAVRTVVFDGRSYVELKGADAFRMHRRDFTVLARVKTREDGAIFSKTTSGPEWKPDCKALFIRGGRLTFDIGWVGAVRGKTRVNDGRVHQVGMTYGEDGTVTLFVDGKEDGRGKLLPESPVSKHVIRFGFASPDFPKRSAFKGVIEQVGFAPKRLTSEELRRAQGKLPAGMQSWQLSGSPSDKIVDGSGQAQGRLVTLENALPATAPFAAGALAAGVSHFDGASWQLANGSLLLRIPAGPAAQFTLSLASSPDADSKTVAALAKSIGRRRPPLDLAELIEGGPARWGTSVRTAPFLGDDSGPFAMDVLSRPAANPWLCRVRITGVDFFKDATEAAVCTWDGDVWRVSNVDKPGETLTWRRIASGMFQPLGVKIVDEDIYISCRDQITILRDTNADGETDFYETFNSDHQVTDHFHEFAMGLQRDADGNFYYAKSARHALPALVPHHGTLLRVSPDGKRTDILAKGFRAANGVCLNPDGSFIVTDQEGHWNPKNRINWVKEGGFYGNMYGYHDVTDSSDEAMEQPLCWITNSFDRSPAELLWVDSPQWGPLQGSLLNLSYGYGRIFVVPHEKINGQVQGGMCQLPIPDAPTGLIRGRFHPRNGQLYACGMFAWAGSRQQPGGLYRVRYTGKPVHLPVGLEATERGMRLTFSGGLNPEVAADPSRYQVKVWSLKRTKSYGSKHYDERPLRVTAAKMVSKGRVVELELEGMAPTWCMEIKYRLEGADGEPIVGTVHNTVHSTNGR